MRRLLVGCGVVCVAAVLGAAPAVGEPSGPSAASDSRCVTLRGLLPATVGVTSGNVSGTHRQARALRALAGRELTPRRVKAALGKLAQWFEDARDRSLLKRATSLTALRSSIKVVVLWTAKICGASTGSVATATTTPLG